MKFYKMQNPGKESYGLMALDSRHIYAYLANTQLWHRAPYLEDDFFRDQEGVYTEITPDQVTELLPGVKPKDKRGVGGRLVRRLEGQPWEDKRTSAELGLKTKEPRAVTRPGFIHYLSQVPRERWIPAVRYPGSQEQAAKVSASEIRNRKKTTLYSAVGDLDARVVAAHADFVLQVKKPSAANAPAKKPANQPANQRANQRAN